MRGTYFSPMDDLLAEKANVTHNYTAYKFRCHGEYRAFNLIPGATQISRIANTLTGLDFAGRAG